MNYDKNLIEVKNVPRRVSLLDFANEVARLMQFYGDEMKRIAGLYLLEKDELADNSMMIYFREKKDIESFLTLCKIKEEKKILLLFNEELTIEYRDDSMWKITSTEIANGKASENELRIAHPYYFTVFTIMEKIPGQVLRNSANPIKSVVNNGLSTYMKCASRVDAERVLKSLVRHNNMTIDFSRSNSFLWLDLLEDRREESPSTSQGIKRKSKFTQEREANIKKPKSKFYVDIQDQQELIQALKFKRCKIAITIESDSDKSSDTDN